MQALSKLAALAAERAPGFVRPTCDCFECDEGTVVDQFGDDAKACRSCKGAGYKLDDSPAALLMAVELCAVKCGARYQIDDGIVMVTTDKRTGAVASPMELTPEAIARAALVALLLAHGVEVSE